MQHVFFDVEALGPPGVGRPFAIGAAKFDQQRGVYARWQGLVKPAGEVDGSTMAWLSEQSPQVLAQLRATDRFATTWTDALRFVYGDPVLAGMPNLPTTFWADDWSDFAWLNVEIRRCGDTPLRSYGPQYDSSAIVKLADPLRVYSVEKYGELVPHVAEHDAVSGALDLIASLNILGRSLP
jgi:hypothetical protein